MQTFLRSRCQIGVAALCACALALSAVARGDTAAGADGPLLAALVKALRHGDAARLGELLRKDGALDARDAQGNTPLILAALYAGPDCLETLLRHKADANAVNKRGATALIRAATDPAKARLLIDAGARIEVQTELGNTPLILAARRPGNAATVKLLLQRGANVKARNRLGVSAILAAAAGGDLDSVRLLVAAGADVNDQPTPKSPQDMIFAGLRTPLMWAAYNNDVPMLQFLLEYGAKADLGTGFGTPLTQAAWHDNVETARLLLEKKVQVDARDFARFTPLHWAASTESPRADLVELLLKAGADPSAEGGETIDAFLSVPQSPLSLAQKRGQTAIVAALQGAGAKVPAAVKETVAPPLRDVPASLDAAALRTRLEPAVAALQKSAASSRDAFKNHVSKQVCFSCHQQFLPMAAVGQVRNRGVRFDNGVARKLIDGTQSPRSALDEFALQPVFHPEPVHSFGYAAFALAADRVPAGPTTDGLVHHLAVIQAPDGRWFNNLPRPPLQSSDVSATALAVLTIQEYGWPGRRAEFTSAVERARKWLWSVKPDTNEEAVYQLLGLHWAGVPAGQLADLADRLVRQQRDDGGWAQLPKLLSDAYATGQALYALTIAARHPIGDRAWQSGMRYLLRTQQSDGTWSTIRRAFPFQPTMDSGFPHGRESWLSAAATSWAILALAQTLPDSQPVAADRPLAAAPPPRKAPQEIGQVDFVKHIQPILERSCVECHSGKRVRGGFRIDSRADILHASNLGKPVITPGDSENSPLVAYISDRIPGLEMPPLERRNRFPALSVEERDLLRTWVDQGAAWPMGVTLRAARK